MTSSMTQASHSGRGSVPVSCVGKGGGGGKNGITFAFDQS